MSPEFGSTVAIFPIDAATLRYLELTGRPTEQIELVEAYAQEQGLWHDESSREPVFTDTLELDLGEVESSLAGPRRPQDRIALSAARRSLHETLESYLDDAVAGSFPASDPPANGTNGAHATAARVKLADGEVVELDHGDVVIAAITSCTNTSNPSVMLGAGLLARNAVARGLRRKPWVKTSLAPGSMVVTDYLERAGLTQPLDELGFNLVGYGCTTCIGNSGPLPDEISAAVNEHDLAVAAVLSGNRNFEGRINQDVKLNYLASPLLVVAYAIAGTMDIDLDAATRSERTRRASRSTCATSGRPRHEIAETIQYAVQADMFHKRYAEVFDGDEHWHALEIPSGDRFAWAEDSTYVRRPPFLEGLRQEPDPPSDIEGALVLALLGDSVTTDHISPAGSIKRDSPAGRYLQEHGVEPAEFNSYGARRGNHEVLMRGTFANIRLRNRLVAAGGHRSPKVATPTTFPTASSWRSTTPRCATSRRGSR